MSIYRAITGLTIIFVSSVTLATADDKGDKGIDTRFRIVKDQSYYHGSMGYKREQCKLDLYLPKKLSGFPVLIWLHGGGLRGGDKTGMVELTLACRLVPDGIAVAAVNYRLSPHVVYPTYLEDCATAVAWVAHHIAEHGGDRRKIFVGGFSAGGYLTAMLALNPKYLEDQGFSPRHVLGFIPISGQLDSHSTVRQERGIDHVPETLDESAPLFHIGPSAQPQLVIIGQNEDSHRMKTNQRYVTELKAAGNSNVGYLTIRNRTHATIMAHLGDQDDKVGAAMSEFIHIHSQRGAVNK